MLVAVSQPIRHELSLALAKLGQRRILAALEPALGDPCRLAVANQDDGRYKLIGQLDPR